MNSHIDVVDSSDFEHHFWDAADRNAITAGGKQQYLFLEIGWHFRNNAPEDSRSQPLISADHASIT